MKKAMTRPTVNAIKDGCKGFVRSQMVVRTKSMMPTRPQMMPANGRKTLRGTAGLSFCNVEFKLYPI